MSLKQAEGKDGILAELLQTLGAKGKGNFTMKYTLVVNGQITFFGISDNPNKEEAWSSRLC